MINGHGDDLYRYGNSITSNFSSNILSRPDHKELMAHLAMCGRLISSYPEPEPVTLEREIASREGVSPDSVMVTNGATEAIYLLAHAFAGSRSVILAPTFREYEDACRMYGHDLTHVYNYEEFMTTHADIRWICNPNNPTGSTEEFAFSSEGLTAVDASYADYSIVDTVRAPAYTNRPDSIRISSLTKKFSVPGLRIGYAIAHPDIINRLRRFRMPWSVNALAIEAALWLMDNAGKYVIDATDLNNKANNIARQLNSLGIDTLPTYCNFLLARLPEGLVAAELKEFLATEKGILIRDASNFTGLTPAHFRVAAQSPHENARLIDAIAEWLQHVG